jgi:hypothetical protein
MFALIKYSTLPQFIAKRLSGLVASLIIAEAFYKFHSFTLECVAFLATWFLIDFVIELIANKFAPKVEENPVHK